MHALANTDNTCNVNLFQVFLRKSEESIIRGPNKSLEKNKQGRRLFGTEENLPASAIKALHLNHLFTETVSKRCF